jgi:DNA-binding NarL/FixJ family response regulator
MTRNTKKIGILLADDHEVVRRGVRGLLDAQRGLQVIGEAADGREAVEMAMKLKPNIAIVDIGMPELDGLEVTRKIRKTIPETRVLILTMHESDEMVRQVMEAGARGFVLKSDLAYCIVKVVKAISDGEFSFSPKVSQIMLNGFLNAGKRSSRSDNSQSRPSPREVETIRHLAAGKTNKEVAAALGITVRTVETYRARIMAKLDLHSMSDLVRYAFRHDLIEA